MTKITTKSEDKRSLILEEAGKLFVDQGFTKVTMVKIAEKANVSKQTVYSYFGNKEDLFAASIENKCLSSGIGEESLGLDGEVESCLREFALRFGNFIIDEAAINTHTLCAYEAKKQPKLAEIFFRLGPDAIITELARYFAHKTQQGELNIPEPRWAANQFLGLIMGEARVRAELDQMEAHTQAEHQRYLLNSVEMFFRAYLP